MPQNFNKPRQWQNASKTNEERQIRVVVCAVFGEPVSVEFSLILGKIQGKLQN
jgi:hypothetical protein